MFIEMEQYFSFDNIERKKTSRTLYLISNKIKCNLISTGIYGKFWKGKSVIISVFILYVLF